MGYKPRLEVEALPQVRFGVPYLTWVILLGI